MYLCVVERCMFNVRMYEMEKVNNTKIYQEGSDKTNATYVSSKKYMKWKRETTIKNSKIISE